MPRRSGGRRRVWLIGAAGIAVGALALPPAVSSGVKAPQEVVVVNADENPIPFAADAGRPVHVTGAVRVQQPERFQRNGFILLEAGDAASLENLEVPDGKDLVVEYVTVKGLRVDHVSLTDGSGTGSRAVYMPLERDGEDTTGSEQTQVTMGRAFVAAVRDDTSDFARVQYVVSGYLIDE